MPELFAAVLLAGCCLTPHTWHGPADSADRLLAAQEWWGQQQRPLNYPEAGRG